MSSGKLNLNLKRYRYATLLYRSAFFSSRVARIEASDPETIEKKNTPASISAEQNIYSFSVPPDISPYPTVVIVVRMK